MRRINGAVSKQAAPEEKAGREDRLFKSKIELLFEEMIDFDTFAKADYGRRSRRARRFRNPKALKFTLNDGTDRTHDLKRDSRVL